MANESNVKDALIAELMGDVGQLSKKLDKLKSDLGALLDPQIEELEKRLNSVDFSNNEINELLLQTSKSLHEHKTNQVALNASCAQVIEGAKSIEQTLLATQKMLAFTINNKAQNNATDNKTLTHQVSTIHYILMICFSVIVGLAIGYMLLKGAKLPLWK